jgi:hypothetical protein
MIQLMKIRTTHQYKTYTTARTILPKSAVGSWLPATGLEEGARAAGVCRIAR